MGRERRRARRGGIKSHHRDAGLIRCPSFRVRVPKMLPIIYLGCCSRQAVGWRGVDESEASSPPGSPVRAMTCLWAVIGPTDSGLGQHPDLDLQRPLFMS